MVFYHGACTHFTTEMESKNLRHSTNSNHRRAERNLVDSHARTFTMGSSIAWYWFLNFVTFRLLAKLMHFLELCATLRRPCGFASFFLFLFANIVHLSMPENMCGYESMTRTRCWYTKYAQLYVAVAAYTIQINTITFAYTSVTMATNQ